MMIGILALILFGLMMVIGGDRGAVSVMSLAGNLLVLSLAIILMAGGQLQSISSVPGTPV